MKIAQKTKQRLQHLGQVLWRLRTLNDMTQSDVAAKISVNRSYIAKLESMGSETEEYFRLPSLDVLLSLSDLFGIGLDELLGMESKKTYQVDLSGVPLPMREPLTLLVERITEESSANAKRERRWRNLSNLVQAEGGAALVAEASHQLGVRLDPDSVTAPDCRRPVDPVTDELLQSL